MERVRTTVRRSAASGVFVVVAVAALLVGVLTAAVLIVEARLTTRAEAERVTVVAAETIAANPEVITRLAAGDRAAATAALQPYAGEVIRDARVDFVTIMTPDGIRVTHRNPEEIGRPYLGTVPATAGTLTEEYTGTLGRSIRTIVPVLDGPRTVGWVSVGVTLDSLGSVLLTRVPIAAGVALVVIVVGLIGAWAARRLIRRVTGDLAAAEVRDAVASYESIRTLGEALRAQTHEHGNRMHTAVALMELGRTEQAIELLTATSRQSQALVDLVAGPAADPTVGALLLGKAAQAAERGIAWHADLDPTGPTPRLSSIDQVALVGNLIDNALDAAADGPEPRSVSVVIDADAGDRWRLVVSDSGTGIPDGLRQRVFEHGFSTKPAGRTGRGVGLSLVASIVAAAGGALEVRSDPTRLEVVLPGDRP